MTQDQFWNIIQDVHLASNGDMDSKCDELKAELSRLPLEEVRSFHSHFDECLDKAYTWDFGLLPTSLVAVARTTASRIFAVPSFQWEGRRLDEQSQTRKL